MAGHRFSSGTSRVALSGVLAAGGLVFLALACIAPSGRLGLNAVSGLFPVIALLSAGRTAGWLCWAAVSLLGLVLLPDKGMVLLFLVFFGLYPVLKSRLEGLASPVLGWLCKLLYFNAVLAVCWLFLRAWLFPELPAWAEGAAAVWAAGNIVFIVYDIGLSRLIFGLQRRLRLDAGRRWGR